MRRAMSRVVLAAAVLCATAAVSLAEQTTSSSTQTKTFEVLAVDGNQLIVKLPEGRRLFLNARYEPPPICSPTLPVTPLMRLLP